MVADMAADMEVHLVAYMEVDKVADIVSDKKNILTKLADMLLYMVADKVADMVAGHGCWLIGPKLFRPEAYPTCLSSKLCEFIQFETNTF